MMMPVSVLDIANCSRMYGSATPRLARSAVAMTQITPISNITTQPKFVLGSAATSDEHCCVGDIDIPCCDRQIIVKALRKRTPCLPSFELVRLTIRFITVIN